MRKPRTVFATPFVVVIGCGHPVDRKPPSPPVAETPLAPEGYSPAVAESDRPIDAGPDAACTIGEITCSGECAPDASGRTYFRARVIRTWQIGDGLGIEIERPANVDDADSSWRAVFIDAEGGEIRDSEFFITESTADRVLGQIYKTCSVPSSRVQLASRPPIGATRPPSLCCTNPPAPPRVVSLAEQCRHPEQYGIICNPPRAFHARIIGIEIQGSDQIVKIGAGTNQGVMRESHVHIITSAGTRAPTDCVILRVTERVTVCKFNVTDLHGAEAEISPP